MPTDEISTLDTKSAFYMIQSYLDMIGETDEEGNELYPDLADTYKRARYGTSKDGFDIYDYLNGAMIIKTKVGKALYRGKTIELSKLWDELEERTIIMRKWLKENTQDQIPIGAYTK